LETKIIIGSRKAVIVKINRMKKICKYFFLKIKGKYYQCIKDRFYKGPAVECPICKWKGKEFMPFGSTGRKNALCPKCYSLERQRLVYLYLKKTLNKEKPLKVLHFAPERCLTEFLKSCPNVEYTSADINPKLAMRKEDITKVSYGNCSFDIIICIHVLEHIENDIKAMKELFRILKPGGFAILQSPIENRGKTFEDFTVTSPNKREAIFGQRDHVRIYGLDYKSRLKKAGFKVKTENFAKLLGKKKVERHSLLSEDGERFGTGGYIYLGMRG